MGQLLEGTGGALLRAGLWDPAGEGSLGIPSVHQGWGDASLCRGRRAGWARYPSEEPGAAPTGLAVFYSACVSSVSKRLEIQPCRNNSQRQCLQPTPPGRAPATSDTPGAGIVQGLLSPSLPRGLGDVGSACGSTGEPLSRPRCWGHHVLPCPCMAKPTRCVL